MPTPKVLEPDIDNVTTDENTELFTIGQLAEELNITTRTIRYYEECGLLSVQRTDGNHRRYSRKDRVRLKLAVRAKDAFTLDEIKELFQIYDEQPGSKGEQRQFERLIEMMTAKLAKVDKQIQDLQNLRGDLQSAIKDIRAKMR